MAPRVRDRSAASAERVLQHEYEELRRPTVAALRSRLDAQRIRFDDADLDAFYNQAWHGLYDQLARGEQVENHGGFLVQAAYRRSIDELRREHPDRRAGDVDPEDVAQEVDLAQRLDDRRRLTSLMEGMRERLSKRECQAAALCYLHGYSRPEAAEALGLAPRRMEKLMDGVSRKIGGLTREIEDGSWCESRQSLMKAYAFGVLDPDGERYSLAQAHLDECPGCRRYVRGLRGIGAIVPPVALPLAALAALGVGGVGAAGGAGAAGGGASGGSGSAGGAGAGAGSGAGAGAGAGAGGFGGLAGGWGVAAVAGLAVAAGGVGAWAVVSSDGGDPSRPAGALAPAPAPAPAPPARSTSSSPADAGSGKRDPAARVKARKPASTVSPAPEQVAATQPAPPPAATPPAPAAAPPTTDGEQEFGFER